MTRDYIKLITSLSLVIALLAIIGLSDDYSEDRLRIYIRWSAKLSVCFFSLAFSASAIHHLIKGKYSAKLLEWRPRIGLCFAVFHTAHLIFLILLQQVFHPVFTLAKTSSLIGGGMAYVFMYLMALTTFPKFKKLITNKQWILLHTIGSYWIWIIFFRSYFKSVVNKGEEYLLFAIIVMAMVLRILKGIHRMYRRNSVRS